MVKTIAVASERSEDEVPFIIVSESLEMKRLTIVLRNLIGSGGDGSRIVQVLPCMFGSVNGPSHRPLPGLYTKMCGGLLKDY